MAKPFDPPLTVKEVQNAFQRVTVLHPLQTGGQGALFVVETGGDQAVLKVYTDAYETRAERECGALENLHSQYIVELYEWGKISLRGQDHIFTITGFIEGQSLRERIDSRTNPLSEAEIRTIGADLTHAIRDLWTLKERLVHRDIKPRNIMYTVSGRGILLDLGIARHIDLDTLTPQGVSYGTHGYMSPEQARARKGLTYKSDFFSLGIVLYEAASLQHPFQRQQILVGNIQPTPLKDIASVSDDLSETVLAMLDPDPLNRPRDFSYLLARFRGET